MPVSKALLAAVLGAAAAPSVQAASCIASSLIITELADPTTVPAGIDDASKARFIQLYNGGDSTISLNGKFAIQIYREDATQPSETAALAGTVNPGEFFIVCNDAEVFNTVYNGECSEEVSTILSDGDDVVSLVQLVVENGALNLVPSDVYGTIGESGETTDAYFNGGRASRNAGAISASCEWVATDWAVASGGADSGDMAPFDWDGAADETTTAQPTTSLASTTFGTTTTEAFTTTTGVDTSTTTAITSTTTTGVDSTSTTTTAEPTTTVEPTSTTTAAAEPEAKDEVTTTSGVDSTSTTTTTTTTAEPTTRAEPSTAASKIVATTAEAKVAAATAVEGKKGKGAAKGGKGGSVVKGSHGKGGKGGKGASKGASSNDSNDPDPDPADGGSLSITVLGKQAGSGSGSDDSSSGSSSADESENKLAIAEEVERAPAKEGGGKGGKGKGPKKAKKAKKGKGSEATSEGSNVNEDGGSLSITVLGKTEEESEDGGKAGKSKKAKKGKAVKAGKLTASKEQLSSVGMSGNNAAQSSSGVVQFAVGAILFAVVGVMATSVGKKLRGRGGYSQLDGKGQDAADRLGLSSSVSLLQHGVTEGYESYGMGMGMGMVDEGATTSTTSLLADGVLE